MIRTVILTGSELRHTFLRTAIALSPHLEVPLTYCEGLEQSLASRLDAAADTSDLQTQHVASRTRSEEDFFAPFVALAPDRSHPESIPKGAINERSHVDRIADLAPQVLAAFGCSLIKSDLVSRFQGRFLNLHLGLSPYYRGSGTNFFPLVNSEPEFVGATFMYLDQGIDTGRIIHQVRARIFPGDTPHQIGNRLIADATRAYRILIENFPAIDDVPPAPPYEGKLYRRSDFTPAATERLYRNFADGLIERYLAEREQRVSVAPIVQHPLLVERGAP